MAQFGDLATEIVIMIVERVRTEDIVSFALTSKAIYSLAERTIQDHREKSQRYKSYDCREVFSSVSKLLDEMLIYPDTAFYIRCLTIDSWLAEWEPIGSTELLHAPYPPDKMLRLKDAALKLAPPAEQESWIAGIEKGEKDPIIAMLLMLLTNVRSLNIEWIGSSSKNFMETLQRISRTPGTPALSKLKTIRFNREDLDSDTHPWRAIGMFATLPAMESITVEHIHVYESTTDDEYRLQPYSSDVTSLVLQDCYINATVLDGLLGGFKALRKFTSTDGLGAVEPSFLRSVLLINAKTSLVSLQLRLSGAGKTSMGSLRDFTVLKHLDTDLILLVGPLGSRRKRLADMLPSSIEHIHLYGYNPDSPQTIETLLTKAAKDKREHLPILKELRVYFDMRRMDVEDNKAIARMKAKCKAAGFLPDN